MLPNKSYLFRAFNEWIIDSKCSPYVLVNADFPGNHIPEDYIDNGQIIFNISPESIINLKVTPKELTFGASFSEKHWDIVVPMKAIKAIYASENGKGIMFDKSHDEGDINVGDAGKKGKGHLHLV